MLKQFADIRFGKDFINLTIKISNGNPSIIEQMALFYKDIKRNELNNLVYNNIDDIILQAGKYGVRWESTGGEALSIASIRSDLLRTTLS